jgi:hypothetical protein
MAVSGRRGETGNEERFVNVYKVTVRWELPVLLQSMVTIGNNDVLYILK